MKISTFQPAFDKIFYSYQNYQLLYIQKQRINLKLVHEVAFDLIENLPNNGTKYLLIFDVSCEDTEIEHNLHRSKLKRALELQNTHIVLFLSPGDVLQANN